MLWISNASGHLTLRFSVGLKREVELSGLEFGWGGGGADIHSQENLVLYSAHFTDQETEIQDARFSVLAWGCKIRVNRTLTCRCKTQIQQSN